VDPLHGVPWLSLVVLVVGALWLLTSVPGSRRFGRDLGRVGADPRAAGPALWVQRVLGLLLIALGVLGIVRH